MALYDPLQMCKHENDKLHNPPMVCIHKQLGLENILEIKLKGLRHSAESSLQLLACKSPMVQSTKSHHLSFFCCCSYEYAKCYLPK